MQNKDYGEKKFMVSAELEDLTPLDFAYPKLEVGNIKRIFTIKEFYISLILQFLKIEHHARYHAWGVCELSYCEFLYFAPQTPKS